MLDFLFIDCIAIIFFIRYLNTSAKLITFSLKHLQNSFVAQICQILILSYIFTINEQKFQKQFEGVARQGFQKSKYQQKRASLNS